MSRDFVALRWRIIRHGPNDERGFGLISGLVAATAVVILASLAGTENVHPSWLTVALTLFGLTWLLGPVLLPGSAPILDPQWFRTLALPPSSIARAMAPSEVIGVGTIITAVALSSLIVIASPYGFGPTIVAIVAGFAQLFFLLGLGRCTAAIVGRLLRSTVGVWLAAFQMSALLAVSFAGWVPLIAIVLPNLGEGSSDFFTPSVPDAVPKPIENAMLMLPTGWSLAAVGAAVSHAPFTTVAMPIAGLLAGGALLCCVWIALTAASLRQPPARAQSNVRGNRSSPALLPRLGGSVWAVTVREITTWFRDPHRKLGLGHAWITPVLAILLVAPTNWAWALPFIGVMGAAFGAMVAVNTYALDGTALWQLITTPGALNADVWGRQLAWLLLIGLPVVAGTMVLCIVSQSPLWAAALGATLAATGIACAAAPLFSVLMPAVGVDARDRLSAVDNAGNAAGGQMMVFTAVVVGAIVPVVVLQLDGLGSMWIAPLILGVAIGSAAVLALTPLAQKLLHRTGPNLLSALAAGDVTRLRA